MTKTKAHQWLKAVISLREYYKKRNDQWAFLCPFCPITNSPPTVEPCKSCLWGLFENKKCSLTAGINREKRTKEWVAESIPRLERWERRLKGIIAKKEGDKHEKAKY